MKRTILIGAIFALMSSSAFAIDFTAEIKQIDGSTFKDEKGADIHTTLGKVCEQALLATYSDERDQSGKELITPEEKFKRWQLASKVHGKDVNLAAEDLAMIKKLIGKGYPPLVVGQAWTLLDPGMK
jgi:hypothetical protein